MQKKYNPYYSQYRCGGKLPKALFGLNLKPKEGGILDTGLELAGNYASTLDVMGLGYGDMLERKAGELIGEDRYIKGADEISDAISGASQGVVRGALGAVPGGSMINQALDTGTGMTNKMFGNEGRDPLYANQEKIQNISGGIGHMAGAVGAGIFTGNVGGAVASGATGLSKTLAATENEKLQPAAQIVGSAAPLLGMAAGGFGGAGGGLNNLDKMDAFASSGLGQALGTVGQVSQYATPLMNTVGAMNAQPTMPATGTPTTPVIPNATSQPSAPINSWDNLYTSSGQYMRNGGPIKSPTAFERGNRNVLKPGLEGETAYWHKYNTLLSPQEQKDFQKWMSEGYDIDGRREYANPWDQGSYDIQGYWKSGAWKNNKDADAHGTDTYKKPNHPTFSTQSIYHNVDGHQGGVWGEDAGFTPSNTMRQFHTPSQIQAGFDWESHRPEHLNLAPYRKSKNMLRVPDFSPEEFEDGGLIKYAHGGPRPHPKKKASPIGLTNTLLDLDAFKEGLANVETPGSENPYAEINPGSGATGRYQFMPEWADDITNFAKENNIAGWQNVNSPVKPSRLAGREKRKEWKKNMNAWNRGVLDKFAKDPNLQEEFMTKVARDYSYQVYGYPNLIKKYGKPQAMSMLHYIGGPDAKDLDRKIAKGKEDTFKVKNEGSGTASQNISKDAYMGSFNRGIDKYYKDYEDNLRRAYNTRGVFPVQTGSRLASEKINTPIEFLDPITIREQGGPIGAEYEMEVGEAVLKQPYDKVITYDAESKTKEHGGVITEVTEGNTHSQKDKFGNSGVPASGGDYVFTNRHNTSKDAMNRIAALVPDLDQYYT
jgi:hypothetical protein